jgi:hypothetical protein
MSSKNIILVAVNSVIFAVALFAFNRNALSSVYLWSENFDNANSSTSNTSAKPHKSALIHEISDLTLYSQFGWKLINNTHNHLVEGDGVDSSFAIRTDYVGYERGSKRVVVRHNIIPSDFYSLRFAVRFCKGFDFALGGKLHGLGPATPITGGKAVNPNGWSARLMFRKNGGLQTYIYHQNMKKKYGDVKIAKDYKFIPDRYYQLKMDVQLNNLLTGDNGTVTVFVDGQKVIFHNNIRFNSQSGDKGLISKVLFSTFHGGNSPEWSPRKSNGEYKTDCAYFDDFKLQNFEKL